MKRSIIGNVFFAVFVMVSLVGCSNQVGLTGKVTYTDDLPVQVGQVVFDDGNYAFRGRINKDGFYRLGGAFDGDGIIPGQYRVYLTETEASEMDENGVVKHIKRVADKYTNPDTSELTCEVKGKMSFDFKVERP